MRRKELLVRPLQTVGKSDPDILTWEVLTGVLTGRQNCFDDGGEEFVLLMASELGFGYNILIARNATAERSVLSSRLDDHRIARSGCCKRT